MIFKILECAAWLMIRTERLISRATDEVYSILLIVVYDDDTDDADSGRAHRAELRRVGLFMVIYRAERQNPTNQISQIEAVKSEAHRLIYRFALGWGLGAALLIAVVR